jgi:pimeloyl-ACP methyl ester carboxylesterase
VTVEGIYIHFIHQKSSDSESIPLILIHGWPVSFIELRPVVDPLTTKSYTSTGIPVSFDVVIPSLPGYAFSSILPLNWTLDDTSRIFNTLMTDILGYETYAVHGTDWGSFLAYNMYDNFNNIVRSVHLLEIPSFL